MKTTKLNQNGIAHLGLLLLVVVVAAVGVVAYRVHQSTQTATGTTSKTVAKVPAKLTSKADVSKATAALDATNIDNGVNPDELSNDLNSLL